MSVNLPNLYAQQFATNVQLLLQQKGSRLRGKVMEMSHYGAQASPVDQIGIIEVEEVVTRFNPMGRIDAPVARRWVLPTSFDLPQLVDSFDELKLLIDPKSKMVEAAVYAAGRQFDRLLISAFFSNAQTGIAGATGTPFNTAYSIANNFGASSTVGLTVAKLREAKRILMKNEVDLEADEIWCALTAQQHDDLLAEVQITSLDFNDKPVLVDGKINRFLGINFVHTELIQYSTSNASNRMVPIWAKSGMHLGIWGDVKTDVTQRKDIQGLPWQAYLYLTAGATRLEEKKVVQVLCNDAS